MTPFAVKNPRLRVSAGTRGTNQAVIRTDEDGNVYPNSFGIIVKKFSDLPNGGYARQVGCFIDTDEDFEYFKQLNEHMFNRLVTNKPIIFPVAIAKGKAALPLRFAEWLQQQLLERFDIRSNINVNTNPGYSGYGLDLLGFADKIVTPATLGPETRINIYAGTNENADLSNFAERPFVIPEDFSVSVPSGMDISYGTIGMKNDGSAIKYRSVEAAFQGIKSDYSETEYPVNTDFEALRKQGKALRQEDFAKMSGVEARKNGRNITDLDRQSWDKDSSTIMKALIKLSFEQNPQALQRLLATGNATLTHTQDKGKWGTEFPKLLMEVRDELRKENPQVQSNESTNVDYSSYELYSGAADGSDKEWGAQARALGIKVKDYVVQDWDALSQEWKDKLDKEYQEVVRILGRKVLDKNSYSGKLVRRDMMQADKADAIFAIGTISPQGFVNGGTTYATTRGIMRGIPVYVFDQSDNTWKVWNNNSKSFVSTSEPTLTPHAAVIGTRGINEYGKAAIKSVLQNLTNDNKQQNRDILKESMSSKEHENC